MAAGKRRALRMAFFIGWLVLALIVVAPVLAQDGSGTSQTDSGTLTTTAPENLNEVAARLAPLLVGAALIERTIEFLFSWSQRAVLDATSSLRGFAATITGLVQVDVRQVYNQLDQLSTALLRRQNMNIAADEGDPTSSDPAHWPLEKLEEQLTQVTNQLTTTEGQLKAIMDSPLYKERKKMVAGVISIVLGITLAVVANLRLFKPLDITVAGWFKEPFDVIDMILAGILMGLGTDWVHQVITLITQGQRALGRTSGGADLDPALVQSMASEAVQNELAPQLENLRSQVEQQLSAAVSEITGSSEPHG